MGKRDKLLDEILSGQKDHSIRFDDICNLLENLGFTLERISGSHHIFSYDGIMELVDLQPDKSDHSKAKAYQVRQVRSFILRYFGDKR